LGGEIPTTKYIFLGDYVSRGRHSIETLLLLLSFKVLYPTSITLLRGNHECASIARVYGLYDEVKSKYTNNLECWRELCKVFNTLPLAAIVNGKILCAHGGPPKTVKKLADLQQLNRFIEIEQDGPLLDLQYSEPCTEKQGWTVSPRGIGFNFGEDVFDAFCEANGIEHLVRTHIGIIDGYTLMFKDRITCMWSCPNYCYRDGNLGSYLKIDENSVKEHVMFSKATVQY
jgi:serine/threonine-protein phosphatase 4 catalytic subunit